MISATFFQILYTRKLARKLESEGINAVVCSNCPGLVNTKISDGMETYIRRIFTTAGFFSKPFLFI